MRWFKYCKFLMVCCLVAVFSGCEEDDDYRGYMLSGRLLRLAGSGGNCRALLYLDGKRRHYLPAFR